jgi:uncharacterized protein YdcH (DUF465 family)
MTIAQRNAREILLEKDAEYQQLASEHSKYEAELDQLSKSAYLNSEALLEEIKLKKLKLRVKDRMEQIALRHAHGGNGQQSPARVKFSNVE